MNEYYNEEGLSEAHVNPEVYNDEAEKSEVRNAQEKFADVLNKTLDFIASSKSSEVALWAVCNTFGAACCEGVGCSDRAARINVTPQALSKQTLEFCAIIGNVKPVYGYDKK